MPELELPSDSKSMFSGQPHTGQNRKGKPQSLGSPNNAGQKLCVPEPSVIPHQDRQFAPQNSVHPTLHNRKCVPQSPVSPHITGWEVHSPEHRSPHTVGFGSACPRAQCSTPNFRTGSTYPKSPMSPSHPTSGQEVCTPEPSVKSILISTVILELYPIFLSALRTSQIGI